MVQRIVEYGAAYFPQLAIILFFFVAVVFAILMLRERGKARRELGREAYMRLQTEMERLTADTVRTHDVARQHLASVASVKAAAQEEASRFQAQLSSSKQEFEQILAEVRSVSQEMVSLAPPAEDPEWTSPEPLLRLARSANDWTQAAAYLARINLDTATSKNLECAAQICRDHGFLAKAADLYHEAAARDPENVSARAELLALSAEIDAAKRNDSLRHLQEIVTKTFIEGTNGVHIQTRFFGVLAELGRHTEMVDFCEAMLKRPLSPHAQSTLHRHLALFYRSLDKPDPALVHCEAAIKLSSDDPALLSLHAQLLFQARKYDEAFRVALRSLQRDPTSARSYILLAEVQEKRVGRHAARDLLQKAVTWADASELAEIEAHLRRLTALDELSEILPTTQPQLIQA
jgi:tetratricopeptide (TPR) repeat protein